MSNSTSEATVNHNLLKIGNRVLKIGNKILTVSDSPVPPIDYVTIGTQTWKIKNLAIDDGEDGIYTRTVNYGQGDVTEYYYTLNAARRVAASIPGWHLPSRDEWTALANAIGGVSTAGTKLKSTYGWTSGNGTDDYGFSAFPAGARISNFFNNVGSNAYFWTATMYYYYFFYSYFDTGANMYLTPSYYGNEAMSVRLVKDSE